MAAVYHGNRRRRSSRAGQASPHCGIRLTGRAGSTTSVRSREPAGDLAKELQIALVTAGHYATAVFGPIRIADELRQRFPGLDIRFVAAPSPLARSASGMATPTDRSGKKPLAPRAAGRVTRCA
jgi:hypothetical protein